MTTTTTIGKYWNRTGYISIEMNNGRMRNYGGSVDGLDFKFSGVKYGNVYSTFDCGILGLSMETISELATWNIAKSLIAENRRRIQVFAGYEDTQLTTPIFDGYVLEALPTNPPEMWINFKCLKYFDLSSETISVKSTTADYVQNLFQDLVCNRIGIEGKWLSTNKYTPEKLNYSFTGNKANLVNDFAYTFGVKIYEECGVLYAIDNRKWLGSPENPKPVNTEYGMLNVGNITMKGATVRKRLDDSIGLCSWIDLTSKITGCASGEYFVVSKTHKGQYRGEDWYTDLQCIRKGAQI